MPGLNSTGRANPDDYNLGRGKVYFAALNTDNEPQGYRDLGNATEFNVTVESETLEHQSSREGLKSVDKEVIVSQKLSLSVTLDEINFQNLSLFMSGATAAFTNGNPGGETTLPADQNSGAGHWYEMLDESGVRCYDIDSIAFNATHGAGLVEGTDYLVNKAMGLFFPVVGAGMTNIDAGVDTIAYTVTMDAAHPATIDEVRGLSTTNIAGALKFVAENPAADDHNTEFEFHSVSLKAEGDFGLISDEFTTMTLTGAAEKNEAAGSVASPTLTIRTYDGGGVQ